MKNYILIGTMLASILLIFSFGVALAAKENPTVPVNKNMSVNETMAANKTTQNNMSMSHVFMPKMIMRMPANMSTPMNVATNVFILQNVTLNIISVEGMALLMNTSNAKNVSE
jgi:H+/gluconate symporter-like permease